MREKLWNLLDKTRFEYEYLQEYKSFLEKCQMGVAVVMSIVCFAVVNLSVLFSEMALVWSLLLILLGLAAVILDKMGIAGRLTVLKLYLPIMSKRLDAFHVDWMTVQTTDKCTQELRELFTKHMLQFSELSDIYLQDLHLPPHKRSAEKASKHTKMWAEYLS